MLLDFLKLPLKSQVSQNFHSATTQNFKSVPKCQISHSVLKTFRLCIISVLVLSLQNYAKWSLIPNQALPNNFNHTIQLKIIQGV